MDHDLTRDQARRLMKPPYRNGHVELMAFAFTIASHSKDQDPKSFQEYFASGDRDYRLLGMKEELKSLYDNDS